MNYVMLLPFTSRIYTNVIVLAGAPNYYYCMLLFTNKTFFIELVRVDYEISSEEYN